MNKTRKNDPKKPSVKVEDLSPAKSPKGGVYNKIDIYYPTPPPKK